MGDKDTYTSSANLRAQYLALGSGCRAVKVSKPLKHGGGPQPAQIVHDGPCHMHGDANHTTYVICKLAEASSSDDLGLISQG